MLACVGYIEVLTSDKDPEFSGFAMPTRGLIANQFSLFIAILKFVFWGSRIREPLITLVLVLGRFLDSYSPVWGQEGFQNDREP